MSKFHGNDWTELSEALGVTIGKKGDKTLLKETQKILSSSMMQPNEKEVAVTIRRFLRVLAKVSNRIDYNAPVWEGLLKLKKDSTLIRYTAILLDDMWT